jgi:hypothetical protein
MKIVYCCEECGNEVESEGLVDGECMSCPDHPKAAIQSTVVGNAVMIQISLNNDGWGDEMPSADDVESYVALLYSAMSEEFPGADITITHDTHGADSVWCSGVDRDDVRVALQNAWDRWCGGERVS